MKLAIVSLLIGTWLVCAHANAAPDASDHIARILRAPDPLFVDGLPLDGTLVRGLYQRRDYQPLWVDAAEATARIGTVVSALRDAGSHGLDPAPYHAEAIARRLPPADPERAAELELLVSDGLMLYVADLHGGRAAPLLRGREIDVPPRPVEAAAVVESAACSPDIAGWLAAFGPRAPAYGRLRALLAGYRQIAAAGGWPALPPGPTLRPGTSDPAVRVLRRRLAASADLQGAPGSSPRFDPALVAAVKRFQRRHGLPGDGTVGPVTRAALDVDVQTRIDQIVANMERWRWLPDDFGDRHVVVNVPAFSARLVEHGETVLDMPVVVGREDRKTPILSAAITRITFNPTWTVPETVARKDIVAHVRADKTYLGREGIRVFGGRRGARHEVQAQAVDWTLAGTDAYVLRQGPGPTNPLGRLRFDIPNVNAVYLHDTPNRNQFKKQKRALSSGCVRIADARSLAEKLLTERPEWSGEKVAETLNGWETRRVTLRPPLPVHVLYETAWVDQAGVANFRDDIYGRDQRLVEKLRGHFMMAGAAAERPPLAREGS
jgi:murein L,D-transpeptidase YcbB/YkuD